MMKAAPIAKAPSALTLIPQIVTRSLGGLGMAQLLEKVFLELFCRADLDMWPELRMVGKGELSGKRHRCRKRDRKRNAFYLCPIIAAS
jgi:hypothetical protein